MSTNSKSTTTNKTLAYPQQQCYNKALGIISPAHGVGSKPREQSQPELHLIIVNHGEQTNVVHELRLICHSEFDMMFNHSDVYVPNC